jgi:hypothetical protein
MKPVFALSGDPSGFNFNFPPEIFGRRALDARDGSRETVK